MSDEAQSHRHDVGRYSIVVKAIVFRQEQPLLMKRSDYIASKAGEWDIPGGVLHWNEDPVEGLKRETQEETGVLIDIGECFDCYYFGPVGHPNHIGLTFLALYCNGELTLSAEHTHLGWYEVASPPADMPDRIRGLVNRAAALRSK